jgi:sec-independent protein translocase protein TatA
MVRNTPENLTRSLGVRKVSAYTWIWTPVQFNKSPSIQGQLGALSVFQNFGIWQIALILVIVLLLFGVGKLPSVGKGMGQAINEFKSAVDDKDKKSDDDSDDDAAKAS